MCSINVIKGLFRVWVLLALCWVVPATVMQFDNLTPENTFYYGEKFDDKIAAKKCKEAQNWIEVLINCQKISREDLIRVSAWPWVFRVRAAELIMLPPLVLLLMGYGVLWAVRGFQP